MRIKNKGDFFLSRGWKIYLREEIERNFTLNVSLSRRKHCHLSAPTTLSLLAVKRGGGGGEEGGGGQVTELYKYSYTVRLSGNLRCKPIVKMKSRKQKLSNPSCISVTTINWKKINGICSYSI